LDEAMSFPGFPSLAATTVTWLLIVAVVGALGLTCTTIVKSPATPAPIEGLENLSVPVPPGAGLPGSAVHPGGAVTETSVVLAGRGSEICAPVAVSEPSLETWMV